MTEKTLHRLRITFGKGQPIQYISHLDLLRAWERLLRRADLPVSYSQGFNPHPKITIAMPLPVGCTGEAELVDVIMDRALTPEQVIGALRPVCPHGLDVAKACEAPLSEAALPGRIQQATYRIALAGVESGEVAERAANLCAQDAVEVTFRKRTFDLRPLIQSLTVDPPPSGEEEVVLTAVLLRSENGRIGRPDVLVEALGLTPYLCGMHRTEIVFS